MKPLTTLRDLACLCIVTLVVILIEPFISEQPSRMKPTHKTAIKAILAGLILALVLIWLAMASK